MLRTKLRAHTLATRNTVKTPSSSRPSVMNMLGVNGRFMAALQAQRHSRRLQA